MIGEIGNFDRMARFCFEIVEFVEFVDPNASAVGFFLLLLFVLSATKDLTKSLSLTDTGTIWFIRASDNERGVKTEKEDRFDGSSVIVGSE